MARITATQTWAAARVARSSGRFEQHQGIAMRFVRPPTLIVGRQPVAAQAEWHITPQVHLAIHSPIHQTRFYAAPVQQMLAEQAKHSGSKVVASAGVPSLLVRREVIALPAGAQTIPAATPLQGSVSPPFVLSLQRAVQLQASHTRYIQNQTVQRMQPMQRIVQQVVTETVQEVVARSALPVEPIAARSLQMTQRLAGVGHRVEVPDKARNVSLQTARPAVVISPASAEGVPPLPQADLVATELYPARSVGAKRGAGTPPINVEQLTDQVVQAINRRTVAHLERTGRLY
jgi:hypothetical protein